MSIESICYAKVNGEPVTILPEDLYIPPDALEVILEIFEGPLDLLLYLIKKQNLDILNIPVAAITKQYVAYVEAMQLLKLELAGEYLEMAALLAEIKSRMLLPRKVDELTHEEDPRQELIRRLQEYERFKLAASNIDAVSRLERDIFLPAVHVPEHKKIANLPQVELKELWLAFQEVLKRADLKVAHRIHKEVLSVRERMSIILSRLEAEKLVNFINFFDLNEGKLGIVVAFLSILELAKERLIEIIQTEEYAPIYIRMV